ncbi:MAG: response regulator [Candidatus Choladocola sp.]|nr:response regulator [Candidatus Choladocola sp.]
MKMMIIDDNKQVREGIRNGIEWESLGISDIKTAEDGKEALDIFREFLPDIVLVDVMMPEMDGLEFLKRSRKIKPEAKVLMISGFSEFEYAVEAMRYGASGYELKPLKMQQLMTSVSNLVLQIRQDNERKEKSLVHQRAYERGLLLDILHGTCTDEKKMAEYLDLFGLRKNSQIILMCVTVDGNAEEIAEHDAVLIEQMLASYFSDDPEKGLIMREKETFYIYQKCSASFLEQMNRQASLAAVLRDLNNLIIDTGHTLSGGVSRPHPAGQVAVCAEEAVYALKINRMAGRAVFRIFKERISDSFVEELYRTHMEAFDGWKGKEDPAAEIRKRLDSLFCTMKEQGYLEKSFCIRMTSLVIEKIRQTYSVTGKEYFRQIDRLESLDECEAFCRDYLFRISQAAGAERKSDYSDAVKKAMEYINNHYREDTAVPVLAEHIGISPNYLSHIFKTECGTSISEYVNQVRIQKAKELISNSNMMIYEIAEAVGYGNYIRFTQVFKKYEGCSPVQFRKLHEN